MSQQKYRGYHGHTLDMTESAAKAMASELLRYDRGRHKFGWAASHCAECHSWHVIAEGVTDCKMRYLVKPFQDMAIPKRSLQQKTRRVA